MMKMSLALFGVIAFLFAQVPLERWLEGEQANFRWNVRVSAPVLSNHQRLRATVTVQVDGNELVKRRGKGQLVIYVQLRDKEDHVYQTRQPLEFAEVKEEAKSVDIVYTQDFFVLPGDYRVSVAMVDTATEEHSAVQRTLHVPPLKNDPLAGAWRDLPAVEFFGSAEPPDSWFLPSMTGRMHLPVETRRPIHVEVLVNVSPSETGAHAGRTNARNLSTVLPALKVLSQLELRNGSMHVAMLDLARRRVSFEQDISRDLDWPKLKEALEEANPNVIDVHALEDHKRNAQFFVAQVKRRMLASAEGAPRVLIVLSGPMAFESNEDLHPIDLAKDPHYRIYYIRYHSAAPALVSRFPPPGRRPMTPPRASTARLDSLEGTLKPLAPRLFDVDTPEQFRKALATLMDELSRW